MKWAWNQLVHIGDYDNPQFTGSSFPNHQWFHENLNPEMTGNPYISLENHWFPTDFPETHAFRGQSTTRGGAVHLSIGRSPTLHHFSNGYHLIPSGPSTTVISWRNFRWNHGCGMDQRLWNTNGSCIGSYWIILDHIGYLFHIFPRLFHMVIPSDCPSYGLPKRTPGLRRYRSQVVGSFWRLPRRRALCVPKGLCTAETASVVLVALVQSSLKFQSLYRIIYICIVIHLYTL